MKKTLTISVSMKNKIYTLNMGRRNNGTCSLAVMAMHGSTVYIVRHSDLFKNAKKTIAHTTTGSRNILTKLLSVARLVTLPDVVENWEGQNAEDNHTSSSQIHPS